MKKNRIYFLIDLVFTIMIFILLTSINTPAKMYSAIKQEIYNK